MLIALSYIWWLFAGEMLKFKRADRFVSEDSKVRVAKAYQKLI